MCICSVVPFHTIEYPYTYLSLMQAWPKHFTKAQLKLMISFTYYLVHGLTLLMAFSILAVEFDKIEDDLTAYFACESTRVRPGKECDRSSFENIEPIYLFGAQFIVGIGYPFVNLMYALNIQHIWQFLHTHCHLPKESTSF